jgi:O-antigen ligase
MIGTVIGWVFNGFGTWDLGRAWGLVYALLAFWAWATFTCFFAPVWDVAFAIVDTLFKIILPFMIGISLIDSMSRLKQLALTLAASQAYVAYELNVSFYDGINRLQRSGFGGLDNNTEAVNLVTFFGMTFFLGLYGQKLWQKAIGFIGAGCIAHCAMFSFSRGALFTLITTAVVSFILIPKRPVHYLYIALAVALCFRLAGKEVRERFSSSFNEEGQLDASAQSRYQLWGDCWDCMKKSPIVGIGPNHWTLIAHTYGWPPGKQSHTTWLHVGAEMGFPGLILLGGLFYGQCVVMLTPLMWMKNSIRDQWLRYFACMVVPSILGFVAGAQFVTLATLEPPFYIVLLGTGVLRLYSAELKERRQEEMFGEPEAVEENETAEEPEPAFAS